jgi:adenine-specific DNA-methyltransferase
VTRVFIGGSRRITGLEAEVRRRLDRIVEKGLPVVIGDANGADKAVQRYLNDQQFEKVEVFSADESPRNNAGGWSVRVIRLGMPGGTSTTTRRRTCPVQSAGDTSDQ